ncbi:hypothetical protein ANCCAN_16486 [Ancylostoma caninum]|uniref:Uncharacterized protein n=1 Tax=Ancylostoma caninum TaxID=29170 RepID=A0A368FZI9_ANCCA|nr:hypothetical protein ANCCAN_16486 [Ancylostoma caninum]
MHRTSFWEPLSESEREPETKRCLLSTQGEEIMIEIQQYSLLLKKQRPEKDSCPFQWWKKSCWRVSAALYGSAALSLYSSYVC